MTKQECTVQFSIVSGIPSFWGDKTVRKGQQWSDCMWWRQNLDVLPVQPLYISNTTSRRWIPQKQQPSLLWARRAASCFVLPKFVISHHLRELGGKGNLSAICWWLEEATLHATVPASLKENPLSSGLWSSAKPEAHESDRRAPEHPISAKGPAHLMQSLDFDCHPCLILTKRHKRHMWVSACTRERTKTPRPL